MQLSLWGSLMLFAMVSVSLLSSRASYAEDVTFVVPGSKDPSLGQSFDPALQIIEKGQAIIFVNPDAEPHHLVIKSNADGQQYTQLIERLNCPVIIMKNFTIPGVSKVRTAFMRLVGK